MKRQPGQGLGGLILGVSLVAATAHGAAYHNRNIDGRHYIGTIANGDYGSYENAEVRFQGDHAYVRFPGGGRLVLILEDEEIVDPHSILGHDPRRGIMWELDLKDLGPD